MVDKFGKRNPVTLRRLVSAEDPFREPLELLECLAANTSEGRYLEWKSYPPIGPSVGRKEKYRWVKAAISFANASGGFIVFGVDSKGKWSGLTDEEVNTVDPAQLEELINGCVAPEIPTLGFAVLNYSDIKVCVLQVPTSVLAPHVTTKYVYVNQPRGKEIVLSKDAVYYRSGAKSKPATPNQHQKIVERRLQLLREELLRRIREVPVMTGRPSGSPGVGSTMRVIRAVGDTSAPVVRLTREKGQTENILVYEELAEGLFEEINNVLDANWLLAEKRENFLLGEEIYYRIYAERQHVATESIHHYLLAKTSLTQVYGPSMYWFRNVPPRRVASLIAEFANGAKEPFVRSLIRLAILLGKETEDWLWERVEQRWQKYPQPPTYYWSFSKVREGKHERDRRVRALSTMSLGKIELPNGKVATPSQLLRNPDESARSLSQACLLVFKGEKHWRGPARILDVLAHGNLRPSLGSDVISALKLIFYSLNTETAAESS